MDSSRENQMKVILNKGNQIKVILSNLFACHVPA